MQTFSQSSQLPGSAAEILAAISTEAYLLHRYRDAELHHLHIEVSQDDETRFASSVRRTGSTSRLPGFAQKLVGDRLTLVQEQFWDRRAEPYQGGLDLHVEGMPGHVRTRLTLRDNGDGTSTLQARGEIQAGIPLLGGRIEKMLSSHAQEAFEKSVEAIRGYLAQ